MPVVVIRAALLRDPVADDPNPPQCSNDLSSASFNSLRSSVDRASMGKRAWVMAQLMLAVGVLAGCGGGSAADPEVERIRAESAAQAVKAKAETDRLREENRLLAAEERRSERRERKEDREAAHRSGEPTTVRGATLPDGTPRRGWAVEWNTSQGRDPESANLRNRAARAVQTGNDSGKKYIRCDRRSETAFHCQATDLSSDGGQCFTNWNVEWFGSNRQPTVEFRGGAAGIQCVDADRVRELDELMTEMGE